MTKAKGLLLAACAALVCTQVATAGSGAGIYWTDIDADKIQRAGADVPPGETPATRTDIEDLVTTGLNYPWGLAIDISAGKMYWAGDGKIRRADLDGTGVEDLLVGTNALGIALDPGAGMMYWANTSDWYIQRANMEIPPGETPATRTDIEDLFAPGTIQQAWGIDVDPAGGKIYFGDFTGLRRANLDGTNPEYLISGPPWGVVGNADVAVDPGGGKVYFVDKPAGKIRRINLDGSNPEDVFVTDPASATMIALDAPAGKLYWTESANGTIRRVNFDGTGAEDLVAGLPRPFGIALENPPTVVFDSLGAGAASDWFAPATWVGGAAPTSASNADITNLTAATAQQVYVAAGSAEACGVNVAGTGAAAMELGVSGGASLSVGDGLTVNAEGSLSASGLGTQVSLTGSSTIQGLVHVTSGAGILIDGAETDLTASDGAGILINGPQTTLTCANGAGIMIDDAEADLTVANGASISVSGATTVGGTVTLTDAAGAAFGVVTVSPAGTFTASSTAGVPTGSAGFGGLVTVQGQMGMENLASANFGGGVDVAGGGRFTGEVLDDIFMPQPSFIHGEMTLTEVASASFDDLTVTGRLRVRGGTAVSAADYAQAGSGLLGVQLEAVTGGFNAMAMTGTAELAGVLRIDTNGAPLAPGSGFTVLTAAGGRSGQFGIIATVQPAGLAVQPAYGPTGVQINFVNANGLDHSGSGNLSVILTGTTDDLSLTPDGADSAVLANIDATMFALDISGSNPTMTVVVQNGRRLSATEGVTVNAGGILTTESQGGTLFTPLLSVQGGEASGNLRVVGSVASAGGTLRPGLSPGRMVVEGDLTLDAPSTLLIELAGTDNSDPMNLQFDQVQVSGAAAVAGELAVSLLDGFHPDVGDSFDIVTAASRAGRFDGITGWGVGNKALVPLYLPDAVLLHCTWQGDANVDECVDGLDFVAWSNNYLTGDTWQEGDFNADLTADGLDFVMWSNNYWAGCPGQVPEPASALVLALGLFFFRKRSSP